MIRLNNKDFSEDELEQLLHLCQDFIDRKLLKEGALTDNEKLIKLTIDGMTRSDETDDSPLPVEWNWKFGLLLRPKTFDDRMTILQAMRSPSVNESVRRQFEVIIAHEVTQYMFGLKVHAD